MEEINAERCLAYKPEGRDYLGELGLDERILKWILKKYVMKVRTELNSVRRETTGGLL
jgi:hypothetical protein